MIRVQRVLMSSGVESATVVRGGDVVECVDGFLAHLTAIERSPNTVRAYAHDLRDFVAFLDSRSAVWDAISLEDIGKFVAWLRLPSQARRGQVVPLPWVDGDLSAATVNRKLSAVSSFYEFHDRHGAGVGDLLARWCPGGRGGSWQPFLAHLGDKPERRRVIALRSERRLPRELSAIETTTLIEACDRLRDRFLLSLLRGTGLRVGEALGLRHEDIDALRRLIVVRQRLNINRARAKTLSREVPADPMLIRLYSDYLRGVRAAGLRLCVRQPLGRAGRPADELPEH